MKYDNEYLQRVAESIGTEFLKWVESEKLAEDIYATYERACTEILNRFDVKPQKLSDELFSRIYFETISFGFSLLILLSPQFFNINKGLFQKKVSDNDGKLFFRDCVWSFTNRKISELKLNKFSEIVVTQITPEIEFGHGGALSFDKRCNEYVKAFFSDKEAEEIEVFGNNLGKALDPYHYPVLSIIGGTYSSLILKYLGLQLNQWFKK